MEVHHIPVADHVLFALEPEFAALARFAPATARYKVFPIDHVGFDEAFDEIGMDDACGSRRFGAFFV